MGYSRALQFLLLRLNSFFDVCFYKCIDNLLKVDYSCQHKKAQDVLRENVVNPLRRHKFVDRNQTMELRKLLDSIPASRNILTDEQDPEEFINLLLDKALNAKPYIELSTGQKSFIYQLFLAHDSSRSSSPTTQEIFQQSFRESNISLKTVPKVLILQMPRNGVRYKMFDKILPTKFLDVTDLVDGENRDQMKVMTLFAVLCIESSHYVSFVRCGTNPDSEWCFFDSMADRKEIGGINEKSHGEYNIPEISKAEEISKCFKQIMKRNGNLPSPFENVKDVLSKRLIKDAYVAFYEYDHDTSLDNVKY